MAESNRVSLNKKPRRGKAKSEAQLSKLQCKVLLWLEHYSHGTCLDPWGRLEPSPGRAKVGAKGVSWNAKRFYDDPLPTKSQHSALSRGLRRLEKRGLVFCLRSGGRTTHVALTKPGWNIATHWRLYGASSREMRTVQRSTPEGRQKAELQARLAKLRGALAYAVDEGDEQLEAKLKAEIKEIKKELGDGSALLKRASIEALMGNLPGSVLMQGLRKVQIDHPRFFERVVLTVNSQKATEGLEPES